MLYFNSTNGFVKNLHFTNRPHIFAETKLKDDPQFQHTGMVVALVDSREQ